MNVTSVSKNFSCDQYRHAEYTSSFNPNETFSFLEETGSSNDAFPIPLNPMYDLQALVMVRDIKIILEQTLTYCCSLALL